MYLYSFVLDFRMKAFLKKIVLSSFSKIKPTWLKYAQTYDMVFTSKNGYSLSSWE